MDELLGGRLRTLRQAAATGRLPVRAEHFGLRLAETYVVAVARPADTTAATPAAPAPAVPAPGVVGASDADLSARRIEEAMVGRFGSHNVLVTVRGGVLVCVVPGTLAVAVGEFTHHVRQMFLPGWRVGLGRPHRGPGGVVTSYREAVNAIGLGDRLELRASVLKAADLLVFPVLLRDRAAIEDLVTTVLSPLLDARGGPEPLLDTLEAQRQPDRRRPQAWSQHPGGDLPAGAHPPSHRVLTRRPHPAVHAGDGGAGGTPAELAVLPPPPMTPPPMTPPPMTLSPMSPRPTTPCPRPPAADDVPPR